MDGAATEIALCGVTSVLVFGTMTMLFAHGVLQSAVNDHA